MRLVEEAQRAGADAVKFQTFRTERLVGRSATMAQYHEATGRSADDQFGMLKELELSDEDHRALVARCRDAGITFLSSPFDEGSADFLEELGVVAFKIPLESLPTRRSWHTSRGRGGR